MRFRLASLQISLEEDPDINLEKVLLFTNNVPENTLLLLPEMFFCGFDYERMEHFSKMAVSVLETLKDVSRRKGITICGTLPKRGEKGLQNAFFLIEEGRILGERAKVKLFSPFEEDKYFVPGEGNPVFETGFGRVGVLICFELRFTEMVSELRKEGIDILLVPAQWGYARREHLKTLSRARAIELQSYAVVSDTWGEFKGTRFAGQSAIYSPWGEVLAFSEKGDTLLLAEAYLEKVREVRETIPMD